jgi:hypothetical protein
MKLAIPMKIQLIHYYYYYYYYYYYCMYCDDCGWISINNSVEREMCRRIKVLQNVDTMSLIELVDYLKKSTKVYFILIVLTAIQLAQGIIKGSTEMIAFYSVLEVLYLLYLLQMRSMCSRIPPTLRSVQMSLFVIISLCIYMVVYTTYSLVYHADLHALLHILSIGIYISTIYLLYELDKKIDVENNPQIPTESPGREAPILYSSSREDDILEKPLVGSSNAV